MYQSREGILSINPANAVVQCMRGGFVVEITTKPSRDLIVMTLKYKSIKGNNICSNSRFPRRLGERPPGMYRFEI
ncbi:MAG: hypothetical protein HRU19_19445 [Pseudobacteriovorax sp.]|nr:hypothetical protein [Pseudobacteriovorax sp.]